MPIMKGRAGAFDLFQDVTGLGSPDEGLRIVGVAADVLVDSDDQLLNAAENATGKNPAPLLAESAPDYLQEDQSHATIEKAYTTTETYKRILNNRVIPRFGRKSPLAIEPLEVEQWLKELRKLENLQNPTLDKIRRVMNLVYKHGQRYGLIAPDASANPMNWVRQGCSTESRTPDADS